MRNEVEGSLIAKASVPREGIGSIAHALHSTRYGDIPITRHYTLASEHNCLHARCTDFVHRGSLGLVPQSGFDDRLAGRRLPYARLKHVAHVDVLHRGRLDSSVRDGGFDGRGAKLGGGQLLQSAIEAPDRRPLLLAQLHCQPRYSYSGWIG